MTAAHEGGYPSALPDSVRPSAAAVASALLAYIVAWYGDHAEGGAEVDPADPVQKLPARQYVAGGTPRDVAWDEEQLTVAIERVSYGGPGVLSPPSAARAPREPGRNVASLNRVLVLEVQLVRCAPGLDDHGYAPGADPLDVHGQLLSRDADHLGRAVAAAVLSGALMRPKAHGQVLIGDLVTLGPDGALAGIAQGLSVPLL